MTAVFPLGPLGMDVDMLELELYLLVKLEKKMIVVGLRVQVVAHRLLVVFWSP